MSIYKVTQFIFDETKKQQKLQREQTKELLDNINGTGFSYTFAEYTVSQLPNSLVAFQVAYASNARKSGETVGNGTGIPCWYDSSDNKWKTFYDNTEIRE